MPSWETYLANHQSEFLDQLLDFLRIPSISTLPEHAADVQRAAAWVAARLRAAGLEGVDTLPTSGHPVVYGEWLHAPPERPTILIYGHYDVQPADPLQLWTHPPFEPVVRDGRVYARGATDDKGNMLIPILAIEALLKSEGALPVNVKFFLEGQEESASPGIPEFLAAQRERFACDLTLSADGLQWSETEANIVVGLKGICAVQIDVSGPNSDVHSGMHGGLIQNPVQALTHILASMRSPAGEILIDGFYDSVIPPSAAERAQIAAVPFDEATYKASLGVEALAGEPGYTPHERNWVRPTLDVNGIWGGFQGEGSKTIIPSEAHAKLTCRLVAEQDPARIADLIEVHVVNHTPPGVKATVQRQAGNAAPYLMPADHPGNQAAHAVLEALYGQPPYYVRLGASIPVCPLFLKELGAYTVSFSFGLADENLHAPDEFLRLSSFERGQKAYCLLLKRLGQNGHQ